MNLLRDSLDPRGDDFGILCRLGAQTVLAAQSPESCNRRLDFGKRFRQSARISMFPVAAFIIHVQVRNKFLFDGCQQLNQCHVAVDGTVLRLDEATGRPL